MKSVFIFLICFCSCLFVNAQEKTIPNSFLIQGNPEPAREAFIKASIEAANMESYRLREKDVVLKFENGFECVMLSAKKLVVKGIEVNPNNYNTDFSMDYKLPLFEISPNGHILAKQEAIGKFKSN